MLFCWGGVSLNVQPWCLILGKDSKAFVSPLSLKKKIIIFSSIYLSFQYSSSGIRQAYGSYFVYTPRASTLGGAEACWEMPSGNQIPCPQHRTAQASSHECSAEQAVSSSSIRNAWAFSCTSLQTACRASSAVCLRGHSRRAASWTRTVVTDASLSFSSAGESVTRLSLSWAWMWTPNFLFSKVLS